MALPPLLTSMTACTFMPSRDTRRMRSTALSRLDMVMALLRSLVTWPLPEGPMEATVRENVAKTGSHFWYAVRSPPAIVVRVRARAPPPPLTGASR
jgi:hypothetical protein